MKVHSIKIANIKTVYINKNNKNVYLLVKCLFLLLFLSWFASEFLSLKVNKGSGSFASEPWCDSMQRDFLLEQKRTKNTLSLGSTR